jgi:quercetin dioxygenase-like cupin family protein
MSIHVKRFSAPDEERPFADRGHLDVLSFGEGTVGRGVFEPGWRWSEHVKPIAGTESCEASHACYVLTGRMHVKCDDGDEAEVGPGDVFFLSPGHDAWTIGDERCVVLDFAAAEYYARPRAGGEKEKRAEPERESPPPAM